MYHGIPPFRISKYASVHSDPIGAVKMRVNMKHMYTHIVCCFIILYRACKASASQLDLYFYCYRLIAFLSSTRSTTIQRAIPSSSHRRAQKIPHNSNVGVAQSGAKQPGDIFADRKS